ncbi:hypothetical protein VNI00_003496 [Paramarasmius palmivorus]|uniref:Ricin B lectin domain-containing protein n=1 Tax=Paramarasmius palmivorus TaxID=297713 RepID=A0AAW0DRZ6_9AGAR
MPLATAYYKITNGGSSLALASETPNTPLSLQQDDGSSQMKWHTENQNNGAYYYLYSYYDGSARKLGATVTTIAPDADVIGGTASKQWVITHAAGAASNVFSIVISGYAITNNNGLAQLEPFDSTASSVPANQQWTFIKWQ